MYLWNSPTETGHKDCINISVSLYLCLFACKTRHNPESCFQCHFRLHNDKGFLVTRCQCPAENRSAHHSSYYFLSPGTAWGYTILPDRRRRERGGKRGEERGRKARERKKDSSKTGGDKRDGERGEAVTVREGEEEGKMRMWQSEKGGGPSSQRNWRQFVPYI